MVEDGIQSSERRAYQNRYTLEGWENDQLSKLSKRKEKTSVYHHGKEYISIIEYLTGRHG